MVLVKKIGQYVMEFSVGKVYATMLPPEQKLYWSVQYDVVPGDEVPQSCATALIRAET
jgi:hypothetical protein